ncbi:hypothetical protein C8N43_0544 [Litoreibacter ponti]|uniref:Uncharacterized protein n=1 Tax=Litoreibacter ponti TaxID=1510457 RepID=A0A2T6BIL9_9RHOB|nr:hypothetical protein [Litoreibacter ponti]PTX55896.1 hypothetical protein C8N43_0544 [Litoreibacter ponti]
MELQTIDRKGLIREAFRIEGITKGECRSIFLDWALTLPDGLAATDAIQALLEAYALDAQTHPMGEVLREGLLTPPTPRRRGGRAARLSSKT